ncbi:NnrS family protein [Sinorhizobium sp. 8-89]|uniref:NnrS family protein n=1 Tax=Sinorhizobium sp. 7-81 TaxID=3049087 RepID=UPI0024C31143|nr:NnrS family protein [Sinorhizobium sp. 7-81]MDK1387708.1 NnrS family protein [Sinorhizobium sp. 7-81]
MTQAISGLRSIWQAPYRPLFLLAGLWALVAPIVWFLPEDIAPDRGAWHSRELSFGMAGAAAGGYLLTALPAWTKKGPVPPGVTIVASCLWCVARLTAALPERLPFVAEAIGASAYFAFLTAVLAHGVVSSGAWHRLWAPLGTAALGMNAVLSLCDGLSPASRAPLLYVILITLIGGRATSAFTRRWLGARHLHHRDRPTLSYLAIAAILVAAYFSGTRQQISSGLLMTFSGTLLLMQMKEWQSLRTWRYPALFILHIAFAWTPAALVLSGLAAIFPGWIPSTAALHALTMGAMGTMMAAFMMRSAMARDGETLVLNRTMACAFSLISLSALLRILGGWMSGTYLDPVVAAAICWMTAWALFLACYLPAISGPVPKPVFSAAIGSEVVRSRGITTSGGEAMIAVNQVRKEASHVRRAISKWGLYLGLGRTCRSFRSLQGRLAPELQEGSGDEHGRAR